MKSRLKKFINHTLLSVKEVSSRMNDHASQHGSKPIETSPEKKRNRRNIDEVLHIGMVTDDHPSFQFTQTDMLPRQTSP